MIYLDTSVVLAHVFAEDIRPGPELWTADDLITSRLTEYECWVRLHAYGRGEPDDAVLAATLAFVDMLELDDEVCARSRAPFPTPVRTLDALHLSAADYMRSRGFSMTVATYDLRMRAGAEALGFQCWPAGATAVL